MDISILTARRCYRLSNDKIDMFQQFRVEYPDFIYDGYDYSESESALDIIFHFSITNLAEFHPTWSIAKTRTNAVKIDKNRLDELVFSLGMVELISYWKLTCSPNVYIKNRTLTDEQITWWKKLYFKGLGEFFYTNGISVGGDFVGIKCTNSTLTKNAKQEAPNAIVVDSSTVKVLIPIGGGKDSAVTLELLKTETDRYCYIVNPRQATLDTVSIADLNSKTIIAKRTLDKNMLELNAKGFLNGHTPFSAILAFSSVIAAYINDIGYVILSNESSASESTVKGTAINHQYSKSYEFENDFRSYEEKHIKTGVQYFSLLRPLTELQIAKLFSTFKNYHSIFKSCNAGSKSDIWCGNCPKCLFVYIILSPFLKSAELISIFGKDMLDDKNLTENFEKLVGMQPEKPFECVGSRTEVNQALQMTIQRNLAENMKMPYLLKYYEGKLGTVPSEIADLLHCYDESNFLPTYFVSLLKQKIDV